MQLTNDTSSDSIVPTFFHKINCTASEEGEELNKPKKPTLQVIEKDGFQLKSLSRVEKSGGKKAQTLDIIVLFLSFLHLSKIVIFHNLRCTKGMLGKEAESCMVRVKIQCSFQ